MGEYTGTIASNNLKFKGDYQICSNPQKKPIFKDREKALTKIKSDYKDTLGAIQETFSLKSFNEKNLNDYKNYSNQLIATSEETKKEAADLSILLEIYENGETK